MGQTVLSEFNLDLSTVSIPKYIAIEGPIGIGKTTLAKRLASSFNYDTLLEDAEENPFLERFAVPGSSSLTARKFKARSGLEFKMLSDGFVTCSIGVRECRIA